MPLPRDSTLLLQGQPKPGDTLHSKPKQAMLVRMSVETLEALEALPKVNVEIGDNPGFYIGGTFFPMRALKEGAPHELYLRTVASNKLMAPLKLHADITGKFIVERELGEKVQDKVREATHNAEKNRTERKTILLDNPLDMGKSSTTRKRNETQLQRRPPAAHDPHRNLSVPSSSQPARTASPRPALGQTARVSSPLPRREEDPNDLSTVKKRLLHFLAIQPRNADEAVLKVGGKSPNPSTRNEILSLLQEFAESVPVVKGSSDRSLLQLKPIAWKEIRPYEWPGLPNKDRMQLARQARQAFSALKIPESNACWEHARYRELEDPHISSIAAAGSSKDADAGSDRLDVKRGITKETKSKQAKTTDVTKRRVADTITAKDESVRPGKSSVAKGKEKERDVESPAPSAAPRPPNRRLPGSGFKVKPTGTSPSAPSPREASPAASQSSKREGKADSPSSSQFLKPLPPTPSKERRASGSGTTVTTVRTTKKIQTTHAPSPLSTELGRGHDRYTDADRERERDTGDRKRKRPVEEEEGDSTPDESLSATVSKKKRIEAAKAVKDREERDRIREERAREKELEEKARAREEKLRLKEEREEKERLKEEREEKLRLKEEREEKLRLKEEREEKLRLKEERERKVRERERERERQAEREADDRPKARDRERYSEREYDRGREKERAALKRDRDDSVSEDDHDRRRERVRERDQERSLRRDRDTDKVRERDWKRDRERDNSPPARSTKRELTPPRKPLKREREPSPLPPRKVKKEESPALPPTRSSAREDLRRPSSSSSRDELPERSRESAKHHRRRSPMYTSSEDEENTKPARREVVARAPPPLKYKMRFRPHPWPSDAAGLRKYYERCYRVYIALYSQKAQFISLYEDHMDGGGQDSVALSGSESDSPLGSMDVEVVREFAEDLRAVQSEMEKIMEALERQGEMVNV